MTTKAHETIDLTHKELEEFLDRVRPVVKPPDYEIIEGAFQTIEDVRRVLEGKNASIARLRQIIFGASTEKMRDVFPDEGHGTDRGRAKGKEGKKRKGHGRNGADDYPGAETVSVPHPDLEVGDVCPDCSKGKLYDPKRPRKHVRVVGQPFLKATVYDAQCLRCNTCGKEYAAQPPPEAGTQKYDETAESILTVMKYGSGTPFYRMDKLQRDLGVPMPASVQWEIVQEAAQKAAPVAEELIRQAAQGEVLHNDDTTMKVLSLAAEASNTGPTEEEQDVGEEPESKRTGTFTTGIVAIAGGHKIALFFTGRNHAGENLNEVLRRRSSELGPPVQMCDGLSRNDPKDFATILANCNAHARRKFVEAAPRFPDECRTILEAFREVYRADAGATSRGLSPGERLELHQNRSRPVLEKLHNWMQAQMSQRKVEPNSGLGNAISYTLKRWPALTLFLRRPGVPVDNNICERILKMAILHRKNALFYKTERGAAVGDVHMTLIFTCRLNGVNPFKYLVAIFKNRARVRATPAAWLPWNYETSLAEPCPSDTS